MRKTTGGVALAPAKEPAENSCLQCPEDNGSKEGDRVRLGDVHSTTHELGVGVEENGGPRSIRDKTA